MVSKPGKVLTYGRRFGTQTLKSFQDLVKIKRKHSGNVLLNYLSINNLHYKINNLKVLVSKFLPNYLVISETKINEESPNSRFFVENYDIWNGKDRNKHGSGLIQFVRKGLICKKIKVPKNVTNEIILSEIKFKK